MSSHVFSAVIGGGLAGVVRLMRFLLLALILQTVPAAANDFSARYPVGSIRDARQAQAALKDAEAELVRIAGVAKSSEANCYRGLLVNSCRVDVRREKELAEREVRRVRIEARDLQRRIDADELAKRRLEKAEARSVESAERLKKQKPSRATDATAADHDPAERAKRDSSTKTQDSAHRQPAAQKRLSVAESAENARKFQQKQADAAKRAQEKVARRATNEEKRAEKRKELDKREAEREAVRRRAGDLEKKP